MCDIGDGATFEMKQAIHHYVKTFGDDDDDKRMRVFYVSMLDFIRASMVHPEQYNKVLHAFVQYIEDLRKHCAKYEESLKTSLLNLKNGIVSFWSISRQYYAEQPCNVLINVFGDGSCFFQCFYYSILSLLRIESLVEIKDMKTMKTAILNRVFAKDGKFISREAALFFYLKTPHIKNKKSAEKYLGFENVGLRNEKYNAYYNAEIETIYLAACAYDVQIIVYRFLEVNVNEEKIQTELICNTAQNNCFTGQYVVTLFYRGDVNQNGHYKIISRYPFIKGIMDDGQGIKGVEIPEKLNLMYMTREFEMIPMKKCILCNKPVLD
jgi:hypothetical protein